MPAPEFLLSAAAFSAVLWAPLRRRWQLSRAKHRSLAGHSRLAKRVARLVPGYAYDETQFFSADGVLKVTEAQRQEALAQCAQADKKAALACMAAFGTTDFRDDLPAVTVPTLVIHGDSDATVPFEGSGARTHQAIPGSQLYVLRGAPHGCTISHADEWNQQVLRFVQTG